MPYLQALGSSVYLAKWSEAIPGTPKIKLQNEPSYLSENQADPICIKSDHSKLKIGACFFQVDFRSGPFPVLRRNEEE